MTKFYHPHQNQFWFFYKRIFERWELIPISRNGLLLTRTQHKIHKNTRILLLKKIRRITHIYSSWRSRRESLTFIHHGDRGETYEILIFSEEFPSPLWKIENRSISARRK